MAGLGDMCGGWCGGVGSMEVWAVDVGCAGASGASSVGGGWCGWYETPHRHIQIQTDTSKGDRRECWLYRCVCGRGG